jgi:protein ImuB
VAEIVKKINARGYDVRAAIADTIGVAWAVARYGKGPLIIASGQHIQALLPLPPEGLRPEADTVERLHKLGLHQVSQFIRMPRVISNGIWKTRIFYGTKKYLSSTPDA